MSFSKNWIISGLTLVALNCFATAESGSIKKSKVPYFPEWPAIKSVVAKDPVIEKKIKSILALMTLEEKVGQMIQPELREVTPLEAKKYKLGSLLNGGGGWPDGNKYATAKEWALESDKYWLALEDAYQGRGL